MKTLYRTFFRSLALGVVIFLVLQVIYWSQGQAIEPGYGMWINFLYVMLYTFTLTLVNTWVFMVLDRVFEGCRMTMKRFAIGVACSFIVSLAVVFLLRIFEDVLMEGKTLAEFFADETLANYYFAMIATLAISLSVHVFFLYKNYQENKVKEQKIIAGTASAKFESLKNQIDPHFLFNSLNVLSSLIEENPDSAQRFTTSLSKVYRYVLEQKDKELVSIEEELSFAKTYMNLLKMRFENSVFYELPQTIANPEAKVVPLSLQLLLENAIKHNIVSQQKPLHIRIFEENGYLVVQNDYQKKEVLQDRKGVGLQNILNRYAIITSRKVVIEQDNKNFTVKLPVLTRQVTITEAMPQEQREQEQNYYKARKKVEDIKGFYGNLFSYFVIIGGLMLLNLATYPEYLWFLYPAIGWGVGIAIHGMYVFNFMPFLGHDWEERKIRQLMESEKNDKWK